MSTPFRTGVTAAGIHVPAFVHGERFVRILSRVKTVPVFKL
jgi:hypothetical protein